MRPCRRPFACRKDAQRAWEQFEKTLTWQSVVDLQIREQPHYARRGKPKNGERPIRVEYFLTGAVASCLQARRARMRQQGMFVLATNELDAERLSAPDVLTEYKGRSHAEGGFRFLKHPEFLASALFLQKPERIMALLMIMTMCLMVYAALEYRIRQGLQQHGQTVLNQVNKPTDRPTARWIFLEWGKRRRREPRGVPAAGVRVAGPAAGIPPGLPGLERSHLHAHQLLQRLGRRSHPPGDLRRHEAARHLRLDRQHHR
ncbi:MAG: IS1634 family transposase, partial [Fuerstiella sp.]|nr:IS1634 family transposase [Fuerstiella sp.]